MRYSTAFLAVLLTLVALSPQGVRAQSVSDEARSGDSATFPLGLYWTTTPDGDTSPEDLNTIKQLDSLRINFWWNHGYNESYRALFEQAALDQRASLAVPGNMRPAGWSGPNLNHYTRVWSYEYHAEDNDVTCHPGEEEDNWRCDADRVGRLIWDAEATSPPPRRVEYGNGRASAPADNALVAEPGENGILYRSKQDTQHYIGCCDGGVDGTGGYASLVTVRYRIESDVALPIGTPVLRFRAQHGSSPVPNPVHAEETLEVGDSGIGAFGTNGYQVHEMSITLVHPISVWRGAKFLLFDVRALGNARVFVDWVGIKSPEADAFLDGAYDQDILNYLSFFSDPVYSHAGTNDEPYLIEMRSVARVDSLARTVGLPAFYAMNGEDDTAKLERKVQIAQPDVFSIDIYPFGNRCASCPDDGLLLSTPEYPQGGWSIRPYDANAYNQHLQETLDWATERLGRVRAVAQEYDAEFMFIPQVFGRIEGDPFTGANYIGLRPPSPAEQNALTWLGLAHGAEGLVYFLYKSFGTYAALGTRATNDHSSEFDDAESPGSPYYTGYSRRWEGLRQTNLTIERVGPTLLGLESTHVFSSSERTPSGALVRSITEVTGPTSERRDVHVGEFDDPSSSDYYVVLVNRMCRPGDSRNLGVQVASARIAREVYDVEERKVIATLAPGKTNFDVDLAPGQGKLVRVRPAYIIAPPRAGVQAGYEFALEEAFPNPVDARTTISFSLPEESAVTLVVYDVLGREVARLVDGLTEAGIHAVELDGSDLASGVYIYQLKAGEHAESRRFVLLK